MKPSERIDQIYTERFGRDSWKLVLAIEVYLDEEWEKTHRHPIGTCCSDCSDSSLK